MILLLLALPAYAATYAGESDTIVQARTDATGTPYVAGWENLWFEGGAPSLHYEGYGTVMAPHGFDQGAAWELYVLSVDGEKESYNWTIGRQRLNLPSAGWMLDGGRFAWTPSHTVTVEAWAGQAEHVGLGSWLDGVPVARLDATVMAGPVRATFGALGEFGETAAVHPDLQLKVADEASKYQPRADLLLDGGVDTDGNLALEKGRIAMSARPIAGTKAMVWGEHREALNDTSGMAPLILATLDPLGYDEVGAGFGWSAADTSRLWVEGSAQSFATDAADPEYREVGWSGKALWLPRCKAQSWCLTPSWNAASGPGGAYHALTADVTVPLPSVVQGHVIGTIAPYHAAHEEWDTLVALGATATVKPMRKVSGTLGLEVAHDALHDVDPRAWLQVRVGFP